ncbi:MAG: urea carboxylase-associated family protein, partial [Pseudomonadota bacterium]
MNTLNLLESQLDPNQAAINEICAAGEPWVKQIKRGQKFRIVDLEGNQAVDTLFYNASNALERYSATDTIRRQNRLYLSAGSKLYSNSGNAMLTIIADTCGQHDTLGGACAAESNTVRYALEKFPMHNCRDNFLHALAHDPLCQQ